MEIECLTCNQKFRVNPSRYARAKFCSLKCRYTAQAENFRDVTGQKFNRLTAVKRIGDTNQFKSVWLWSCDCGNSVMRPLKTVVTGNIKACGCMHKGELANKGKDISGKRFGNLTAIKQSHRTGGEGKQKWFWQCLCDCGNATTASVGNLSSGKVKTCGCRMGSKGENAYNWSGGKKYDSAGYAYLYKPELPNATRKGYIAEHRFVMEKKIGRPLTRMEEVHHLNGIKDDNRPENLELWSGSHPRGSRVKDLVEFARDILARYGDLFPEK